MDSKGHLFDEFPATSKEQWVQQVIKDLKGGDFDTILKYTTADGIEVAPFYTQEDIQAVNSGKPLFTHIDWEVCEEIVVSDELSANKTALKALEGGATALLFICNSRLDLEILLKDISMQYIGLQFRFDGCVGSFSSDLDNYLSKNNIERVALNLTVNYDPISNLVNEGKWQTNEQEAKQTFTNHIKDTKGSRNVCINGAIYHNAGATPAYELACILAHANEYLQWIDRADAQLQIHIATGPDYFFEIAKLRALRKVFTLLLDAYGSTQSIYIHAESAERNLTLYDDYNNLLRTTTEAMSSTIGGCNSLLVKPFDFVYNSTNELSSRLARNIQLILKEESYFDKVADVSAGSFFIETLTEEIATKAWSYFQEIEKEGGFIACFEKGSIQNTIAEFADQQQQKFDDGKEILIGTNKYPDPKQRMKDKLGKPFNENSAAGTTTIKPLQTIRLSERYEQERLAEEVTVH